MYFDDRERLEDFEEIFRKPIMGSSLFPQKDQNSWVDTLSNEKFMAIEKFLGFNPKSASKLTDEQIEEETLRWVVDTDIVLSAEEEKSSDISRNDETETKDRQRVSTIKYDRIKDLLVASSCHTTLESLTFLWNAIADAFEEQLSPSSSTSVSSNSIKLIVFPKSDSLWNYDTIVTMLKAIQIAKPLLPSQFDLRLDLFHPNFKHSPRMWSPQWHSPFPTIGLTIKATQASSIDDFDLEKIRGKLDILFESGDAVQRNYGSSGEDSHQILAGSKDWFESEMTVHVKSNGTNDDKAIVDWTVQSQESPFRLYKTIWDAALRLSTGQDSTSIIVDPFSDSYTLHRVAVTVNAALKRLDIPVRISQVNHPFEKPTAGSHKYTQRPPYGMIQLVPVRRPRRCL